MSLSVLVCGGGIAGNTLAWWLHHLGHRPTVVERAAAPRPGGQLVDLRGSSREVLGRMGLLATVEERRAHEKGMLFVDPRGRDAARMPAGLLGDRSGVVDLEISRGDLNDVLLAGLEGVDYRYGDHVVQLHQDDDRVEAVLASGSRETFDVVAGADGMHSRTRRMVFGDEPDDSTYLGGYASFFTVPAPLPQDGWFRLCAFPGARTVGLRDGSEPGAAMALMFVRTEERSDLRTTEAQQRFLRDTFADTGWVVPELVDAMAEAPDFYFDDLRRVTLPSWSHGRVALLGDAAHCGSPLTGRGTAMAVVGGCALAVELARTPADVPGALARYEAWMRPRVARSQKLPPGGLRAMTPNSMLAVRSGLVVNRLVTSRPVASLARRLAEGRRPERVDLPVGPTTSSGARP